MIQKEREREGESSKEKLQKRRGNEEKVGTRC